MELTHSKCYDSIICPLKMKSWLRTFILTPRFLNFEWGSGLVMRSAIWSWVETWATWSAPAWTYSLTKWKSRDICFILECKTGFEHKYVAPILSQNKIGLIDWVTCNSLRRFWSHIIFDVAAATALYSASVKDLATVLCFLELHEIGFPLRNIMYAEVEVPSSALPPPSASV